MPRRCPNRPRFCWCSLRFWVSLAHSSCDTTADVKQCDPLGSGRDGLILGSWLGTRRCIPDTSFGRGGGPTDRRWQTSMDPSDAANAVGQCVSGLYRIDAKRLAISPTANF